MILCSSDQSGMQDYTHTVEHVHSCWDASTICQPGGGEIIYSMAFVFYSKFPGEIPHFCWAYLNEWQYLASIAEQQISGCVILDPLPLLPCSPSRKILMMVGEVANFDNF